MSTTTPNYNLIKPELSDPANITDFNSNWDVIDENLGKGGIPIVNATSTDGVTYTANAEDIKSLSNGLAIFFVPDKTSTTTTPTIDLNGLGAKNIRRKISIGTGTTMGGGITTWLYKDRPSLFVYDGSYWIALDFTRPAAQDLYGIVPVANGGTGADNPDDARANLGVPAVEHEHSVDDITGILPISKGGTNANNATDARTNLGITPVNIGAVVAPIKVTGTGSITVTVEDNREYSYTNVTSLSMTGKAVDAHGFITFASSTPSVSVTGFTASAGDDIKTEAAAAQVWEFSVYPHNGKSYIIWKNWSDV